MISVGTSLMYAEGMPIDDLACAAAGMADAVAAARASAGDDGAVLIAGERGTGKETVARFIHQRSRRAAGPFVPVDCTTLDVTGTAIELFGRRRGTAGAARDSLGLVRAADRGTLYLDEVAALDLPAQRALARAIRLGAVERVGDQQLFPIDVRVIASTTVDVRAWVASGAVLPELQRLWAGNLIRVPALRERSVDVPDLARCLLRQRAEAVGEGAKSLTGPAAAALRTYGWPGNLPELAQSMHAAANRVRGRHIDLTDLPGQVRSAAAAARFVN